MMEATKAVFRTYFQAYEEMAGRLGLGKPPLTTDQLIEALVAELEHRFYPEPSMVRSPYTVAADAAARSPSEALPEERVYGKKRPLAGETHGQAD